MSEIEITPESITDKLITDYMAWRNQPDDPLIWQEHFQGLVDVLIKHEIVSPPVSKCRPNVTRRNLGSIGKARNEQR